MTDFGLDLDLSNTVIRNIHSQYIKLCPELATYECFVHDYTGPAGWWFAAKSASERCGVGFKLIESKSLIRFHTISSDMKGLGSRMVQAVIEGSPKDFRLCVYRDWSGGFWEKMKERYPERFVERY